MNWPQVWTPIFLTKLHLKRIRNGKNFSKINFNSTFSVSNFHIAKYFCKLLPSIKFHSKTTTTPSSLLRLIILFFSLFIVPHRLGLLFSDRCVFFFIFLRFTCTNNELKAFFSVINLEDGFNDGYFLVLKYSLALARHKICFWDWQSGQSTDDYSYGNAKIIWFYDLYRIENNPSLLKFIKCLTWITE